MALDVKPSPHRVSQRAVAFILALALPFASSFITQRTHALQSFPLALHFLSVAIIATLGGFGPALTAVALSLSLRYFHLQATSPAFPWRFEAIRALILLALALIICFMSRRRRISEARLSLALEDVQERTDALVATLNSSKCAFWVSDLDTRKSTRWHPGSFPIFGRPFSEIEQLPSPIALLHPDDQARMPALIEHLRSSTEPVVFEFRVPWPNGDLHWLESRATRVPGPRRRWRGVALDITERKQSEAALLRSEKLAAMGRIASTVAHEINNPLEAVTNLLYLAHLDESLSAETRTFVASAERELARLGNITRLTLGFVLNSGFAATVDLSSSIDDVIAVFQHRLESRGINIIRDYEPEVCVTIPLHEIRQVATNLIANAADAVRDPDPSIYIRVQSHADKAILLVEDNGEGIPPANVERIFEPFFSTREEVGTGIGLWVTREIVDKNGGRISVESGDFPANIRTRFRVELPLAPSPPLSTIVE